MRKVHFIGIGGTGISAIARMLIERGWQVSGSDVNSSPYFDAVTALGARTVLGHDPELAAQADLVVRSSAVKDSDPEVVAAIEHGIPVLKRSEFLPVLTQGYDVLAIAGSHGKTSTTAMLIHLLNNSDKEVNFILGSTIKGLDTNARSGSSPIFVIEADEYDHMFLGLNPMIAVITNIEYDHPDFFVTPEIYTQAFADFANKVRPEGMLLLCADDPGIQNMLETSDLLPNEVVSYGFSEFADYRIINHKVLPGGQRFEVCIDGSLVTGPFELNLPGKFNALNAVAAIATAHLYGIDMLDQKDIFSGFQGTSRRFDLKFQNDNWLIFDDYGHHPSQISQTIAAARELYPVHTIWAVWEPHTISRTKRLHKEFAQAIAQADQSVILKLFGARETDDSFSPQSFVSEANQKTCHYLPDNQAAIEHILTNRTGKDLVIVFSAGNGPGFTKMLCEQISREHQND